MKLLIENDIVEPPLKGEGTILLSVTKADDPVHCKAEFTFFINI
jgi:hypothetical protein